MTTDKSISLRLKDGRRAPLSVSNSTIHSVKYRFFLERGAVTNINKNRKALYITIHKSGCERRDTIAHPPPPPPLHFTHPYPGNDLRKIVNKGFGKSQDIECPSYEQGIEILDKLELRRQRRGYKKVITGALINE